MISASEPLEFVPHGRTVLLNHPGQVFTKGHNVSLSENSLLYKLTNFAIQDDSFLEYKEEEQEWWCIREVYYRASDELEEEPSSPKDKTDFASESFRPPSRLKPDFNVSIKSELVGGIKRMETDTVTSAGQSQASSVNSSSNLSKKFNLNSGQSDTINKKPFNPVTDCSYEEELYVKGCTAVWSKGLISTPGSKLTNSESRETICCYTLENPIKHATFCNFHVSINNTMLIDALNSQIGDVKKNIKIEDTTEHIKTKILPSILLVDNKCIKVFAKDGREYIASIPFQVKKVWPMKYGVLLEKEATPMLQNSMYATSFFKLNESHNNSTFMKSKSNIPLNMSAKLRAESVSGYDQDVPLPTCFSLSHPLDEVTPILMKSPSSGIHYYNDGDLQIMFVSTNPSIVLIYDWKLGTHSLWHIRKATRDECLSICPTLNSTTTMFSQSCDFVGSPLQSNLGKNTTSWATGLGSPYQSKKGPSTPTLSRSRQNSPMANIFHQQGLSPHASIGQASSVSMLANTVGQSPPSLPLYPDICLDHIWTDSQTIRRDSIKNPSDCKTFLHTDLVGHEYLCFMVKVDGVSRLQIARLQRSHNHGQTSKSNLIVGSISSVAAKDAEVLDHLNMIVLVDDTGNIVLQSGNSFVGKVHIGGVLARLLHSGPGGSVYPGAASMYPRRSSLLPHGAEPAACHLLSPVPHPPRQDTNGILGIRDACGRRFTLQLCTGGMVRVWLPAPRTSICPLKCPLRPDQTRQVLIKWYGVRNAPGTQDLSPEQEWNMFSNLLYSLIGYDVEKLSEVKQNDDQTEAEVVPKKQRTSSDGTQDDWEYLLGSKLHTAIGNPLANMLNLKPVTFEIKHASKPTKLAERHAQFNTNALLFPYTFQVFFAYHLLYEETKLNTLLWSELKPLAKFLYQLAKDLKLVNYVNHYWLDFPTDFDLECEETESQITEDILAKLTPPTYFTYEPPNIFSYLNNLLLDIDVGYYPYLTDVNNMSKNLIELVAARSGAGGGVWAAGGEGRGSSTPRLPSENDPPAIFAAGITQSDIESLPCGLALVLNSIITSVRANPAVNWPAETYKLLGRDDLYTLYTKTEPDNISPLTLNVLEKETAYTLVTENVEEEKSKKDDTDINTGMEHLNTKLLKLLYPRDHRMAEVQKLLQSSIPVSIKLTQRPEVSDHDFIDEQEKHLFAVSTRTMALPIARGMITYRTVPCLGTESLSIPALTVSGRGPPPRCATVSLPGSEAAAASLVWPTFHNGVAAGLALVPVGGKIDANWVIYNKPRNGQDWSGSHGGLLMALGLMGQLRDMPFMQIYDYLVKCHDLLSCGLLLGLAATYRGTMDVQATKLVSIHLAGLLPPTSVELELQQSVACAALLAAGLLYEGTCHAHIAAVLLADIGTCAPSCRQPPGGLLPPTSVELELQQSVACAALLAAGLLYEGTCHAHIAAVLLADIGTCAPSCRQPPGGLLPPTSVELELQQSVACAALLAAGLLYEGTCHAHIAAVLLADIGTCAPSCRQPPGGLLPPTSVELELQQSVACAALLAAGLLYEGTCHAHIAAVLLADIGTCAPSCRQPPGGLLPPTSVELELQQSVACAALLAAGLLYEGTCHAHIAAVLLADIGTCAPSCRQPPGGLLPPTSVELELQQSVACAALLAAGLLYEGTCHAHIAAVLLADIGTCAPSCRQPPGGLLPPTSVELELQQSVACAALLAAGLLYEGTCHAHIAAVLLADIGTCAPSCRQPPGGLLPPTSVELELQQSVACAALLAAGLLYEGTCHAHIAAVLLADIGTCAPSCRQPPGGLLPPTSVELELQQSVACAALLAAGLLYEGTCHAHIAAVLLADIGTCAPSCRQPPGGLLPPTSVELELQQSVACAALLAAGLLYEGTCHAHIAAVLLADIGTCAPSCRQPPGGLLPPTSVELELQQSVACAALLAAGLLYEGTCHAHIAAVLLADIGTCAPSCRQPPGGLLPPTSVELELQQSVACAALLAAGLLYEGTCHAHIAAVLLADIGTCAPSCRQPPGGLLPPTSVELELQQSVACAALLAAGLLYEGTCHAHIAAVLLADIGTCAPSCRQPPGGLLPPTSVELELQQSVACAALLAAGLLYEGTCHAHIAAVLLADIGTCAPSCRQPPGGLLPPTSVELELQQSVACAALLAAGLLYEGTCHAHIAAVLLADIGTCAPSCRQPPGGLLPPTSVELELQQSVACAALLAAGLLYEGTCHAHIAAVLLADIGTCAPSCRQPPGGLLPPTSVELELQQSVACAALLAAGLLYEGTCHAHIAAVLLADIGTCAPSCRQPPGGLLPPTSVELELQQSVACAALLAAGLLYEGTCHAHIAAVLLADIGKPPGPEMENCVEREGYSLAAGLALGMVCAGAGPALPALAPALRTYMLGGDQPARGQKDKHNQNSVVNLDVTAPGATLALGLVYLKTNNKTVASWLEPPSTSYLLEHVRPDLLLLRGIARGLIMWDSIEPSIEWVEKQVPLTISKYCFVKPTEENVDYEAMNQAYCVILTGAVVALGLKHAGSGHGGARAAALHGAGLLLALGAGRAAELCTRQLLESCAASCLLSAAMVMAGRGDLDVLRLCRRLRTKLPTAGNADALTHGGQMAVHMAAGLCFLGGGRCTLASSPRAVAALLAACFPKFPTHSEDNRYHLQAFRHLYVLAVEPRLILPRDIDTGKLCYAHIQVVDLEGAVSELKAPCIIPSLDTLKEVKINDPRYWPISFQKDRNWDQLKKFLEETWCVDIKQRAGCLSYLDDPQGFLTILAQTLTLDKSNVWSVTPENIELFTNDHKIKTFVKHYLSKDGLTPKICADCLMISRKKKGSKEGVSKTCLCRQYNVEEQEYMQGLSLVTYECVIKDVLCVLPLWMTFLKIIKTMKTEPSAYHMWQIKLLLSQIEHHNKRIMNEMKIDGQENQNESLIPTEFSLSIKQKVANIFDSCELKLNPFLRKYLGLPSSRRIDSCEGDIKKMLSCFIVFHDIPKVVLRDLVNCDELEVLLKLEGKNLSAEALSKIGIILK